MQVAQLLAMALIAFGVGLSIAWIISTRSARSSLRKAREHASETLTLAEEEAAALREATLKKVNKELNQKHAALNLQHATLEKTTQELHSERTELATLCTHLEELEKNLENKNAELNAQHAALVESSQELANERIAFDVQQSNLEKIRKESENKNSELDARLNALDKAVREFDNKRTKLDEQYAALGEIRQGLDKERANLDTQRSTLEDTRNELDNRRAQFDTQRSALEDVRKEHDQERAELDAQRSALENERAMLDRRRQQLEQKAARLNEKHDKRRRQLRKEEDQLLEKRQQLRISYSENEELKRQAEHLHERADECMQEADRRTADLDAKELKLDALIDERIKRLETTARLTRDKARQHLRDELIEQAQKDASLELLQIRDKVESNAKQEARKIVLTTMQRLATKEVESNSVSAVSVPSGNIKGRIIGKDGRNLRAFEAAAKVDLLIDDTPDAIIISSFDPYRREVARIALRELIRDGRIDPRKIEQLVEQAQKAVGEEIQDVGKRALLDLELRGMDDTLVQVVGKMKYRTSYGQNLLDHSIEVARLCSLMAAEMELDAHLARRAGLLHDIGKVVPESADRSHELVSMEYCKRYGEHETICNAVGAHHDKLEKTTPYAHIVQVCDAISAARPGARNIDDEKHFERLRDMEKIAKSFDGVSDAYAVKGGRELHVMVNYTDVGEREVYTLSRNISTRIQKELQYPGQVNVDVIREVRGRSVAR